MKLTDKSVIAASLNESKGILTKISPSLSKLPPSFPNVVWYWVNANQGRLETWFDLLGEVPGSEEFLVQQIEIHRSILNYFLTHLNEILDSAKKKSKRESAPASRADEDSGKAAAVLAALVMEISPVRSPNQNKLTAESDLETFVEGSALDRVEFETHLKNLLRSAIDSNKIILLKNLLTRRSKIDSGENPSLVDLWNEVKRVVEEDQEQRNKKKPKIKGPGEEH
jgi:hypothetical protein